MKPEETQEPTNSRVWWFVGGAVVMLVLFTITALMFGGGNEIKTVDAKTSGSLLAFVFAALALGFAIAANASAFLNPNSHYISKLVSPLMVLAVFAITIPYFVTLGITVAG